MSNGKGDAPRPRAIGWRELQDRWAATFGMGQPVRSLDKADTVPKIATHEPDPSGGQNIVT